MTHGEFFSEIEHREVPWGERTIHVPVFYQKARTVGTLFSASLAEVRKLLPSHRLHPICVSPGRCLLSITAHEFLETDIGPYNEVGICIPFTLDVRASLLRTLLGRSKGEPKVYVHQLPVTTEIARDLGVEFGAYPKFLAQIDFEEDTDWRTCRLEESGKLILTLAFRKSELREAPRDRSHCFTVRKNMLLRSELITSERQLGTTRNAADIRLELGDHPIANELSRMKIGRVVAGLYAPSYQFILTPVIESLPA